MKPAFRYVFVAILIMLLVLLALSYSGKLEKPQPTPTVVPGEATLHPRATNTARVTQTPLPTYTLYPTYTPYPTATFPPTATLAPTPSVGTRQHPAAIGEVITVTLSEYSYAVSITQIVVGTEAAQRVVAANRYNDLPGEGEEYLLFYAVVKILSVPGGGKASVTDFDFSLVDGDGRVWNPPSIVDPDPQLTGSGFAGAVVEGWGTHLRQAGEAVNMVFGMNWDGSQGVWFSVPQ